MHSTTRRMARVTSRVLVAASAVALAVAAGCSSGSETEPSPSQQHQPSPAAPVTTTDSDWKPVADALGRSGKLGDNNTAYRVALPRNDLQVTSYGVAIKPGLSLGGYSAFARYTDNMTLLMGDLVVTEAELPKVTDALQAHGRAAINGDFILTDPEVQKVIQALRAGNIAIVELHNHGLTEQPRLFYMHFWAVDDAVALARVLRPALDATNLKPA